MKIACVVRAGGRRKRTRTAGTSLAAHQYSVAQPGRSGRACRRPPPLLPAGTTPATRPWSPGAGGPATPEAGLAARTRARHAEVHAALARGLTITEISRTLRLERKTVRRYATAATADHLICGPRLTRPGLLGPHQAYLRQRWDEGIRSTERLHAELRERGYRGSQRTLRGLTAQLRCDTAVPAPPPAPAARKVASWILTPPGKLTDGHRAALAQITARCEELNTTRVLVREFAEMLCHRHGGAPGSLGCPGREQPGQRATRLRRGTAQRLGRRHRRAYRHLQFRRRRRPRQPHQDDQKTDVRPREPRPPPQPRPARRLTRSRQLSDSYRARHESSPLD